MAIKEHLARAQELFAEADKHIQAAKREAEEIAGFLGSNGKAQVAVLTQPRTTRARSGLSLPDAVRAILPDAGPMSVADFFEKAQERGYATNADNPVDSIDIQLYKLAKTLPILKVAKRTWEWKTDHNDDNVKSQDE
jgi:hypothetical protein